MVNCRQLWREMVIHRLIPVGKMRIVVDFALSVAGVIVGIFLYQWLDSIFLFFGD